MTMERNDPHGTGASGEVSGRDGGLGDLLRLEGVTRRFGAREVVRSLDLAVARGERVAFCGPNGSGKTTVLRCIVGTLTPTSGRITIGENTAGTLEARRLLGVSFSQERSFYLRLSGRDNLLFYAGVRGRTRKEAVRKVNELSDELELDTILPTRADRCSTGMIQQLAFARALIGEPELLLLDEPTRSLDHDAVGRLWAAIDRRASTALVIATHNEDDIERCGRRIDFSAR